MLIAAVILLSIVTLFILEDNPLIGFVVLGVIALTGFLSQALRNTISHALKLEATVKHQEQTINTMAKVLQQLEEESLAAKQSEKTPISTKDIIVESPDIVSAPKQNQVPSDTKIEKVETPAPVAPKSNPFISDKAEEATSPPPPKNKPSVADWTPPPKQTPRPPVSRPDNSLIGKLFKQIELLLQAAWTWVTTGNVFVRVGIIILFMGMTFLTRYAIGQNIIPIELRLGAVSAVAIGLLLWGWLQREKKPQFGLVVQGGGVALLYLTIFASFSLYAVISSPLAFGLLLITVALAACLAVLQDARALAIFATIGGFLAPILTSSGSNNFVGLFSYYTILNIGIFAIAWFQSWRILNFIGFIFTFGISTAWGVLSYQPENFASVEPFLITFFLLYVGISVLFAFKRAPSYKDYVDSSLTFGTPLLAFGLQSAMVARFDYGIAISAFTLAAFYLLLTKVLWSRFREQLQLLTETFLSLGVIFATLAIPFAIDGALTGAIWAIEGVGILWLSIRQQHMYRRLFAMLLILASGLIMTHELLFILRSNIASHAEILFLNSAFIGCLIITISSSCASWLLSRPYEGKRNVEPPMQSIFLIYGISALLLGFRYQIIHFNADAIQGVSLALLGAITMLAYGIAARRLEWSIANNVSAGFIVIVKIAVIVTISSQQQLAENWGYAIWPAVLLISLYSLYLTKDHCKDTLAKLTLFLFALITIELLLWEGLWQLLLGYSLLTIIYQRILIQKNWSNLIICSVMFFPVLLFTAVGALSIDNNLYLLSNLYSSVDLPFAPGPILWPFAFVVYFYSLFHNQKLASFNTQPLVYGGGLLIIALLLWLGTWPLVLVCGLLSVLCFWLWEKIDWTPMRVMALWMLPLLTLTMILKFLFGSLDPAILSTTNLEWQAPLYSNYIVWLIGVASMLWVLWRCDKKERSAPSGLIAGAILFIGLWLTWKVSWHALDYMPFMHGWHLATLPLTSLIIFRLLRKAQIWPFKIHADALSPLLMPILSIVLVGWSILQLFSSANSAPLPWLPLINPVDIVQALIMFSTLLWGAHLFTRYSWYEDRIKRLSVFAAFLFVWANVELLRAVHYWGDVPWELPTIISRYTSQTVLSLFWALCGLSITVFANRRGWRGCWLIGAGLLGVVVLKLFIVELAAQGTIERIISFTGVGLLLTLVGYFAPMPPKKLSETAEKNDDTHAPHA